MDGSIADSLLKSLLSREDVLPGLLFDVESESGRGCDHEKGMGQYINSLRTGTVL